MPKKPALLFLLSSIGAVFILILTFFNLHLFFNKGSSVSIKTSYEKEIAFWQGLVANNPSYTDGYLELAKLAILEGNYQKAKDYFKKAETINPNSEKVKGLKNAI